MTDAEKQEHPSITELRDKLSYLKMTTVAKNANVPIKTIRNFYNNIHVLNAENFSKVKEAVDKIIEKLNGGA
jgi:hypothetical protein